MPEKVIRLSESTNSAKSNAKNLTTKKLEKTESSTKANQDHALQVENMSELEKIDLLACKITAKLVIANGYAILAFVILVTKICLII